MTKVEVASRSYTRILHVALVTSQPYNPQTSEKR
jgi:hypothetical protein